MAAGDEFRRIVGDDDDGHAGFRLFAQDVEDLGLRPDVDADRGTVEDEDLGRARKPLGEDDPLAFPPESERTGARTSGALIRRASK